MLHSRLLLLSRCSPAWHYKTFEGRIPAYSDRFVDQFRRNRVRRYRRQSLFPRIQLRRARFRGEEPLPPSGNLPASRIYPRVYRFQPVLDPNRRCRGLFRLARPPARSLARGKSWRAVELPDANANPPAIYFRGGPAPYPSERLIVG